MASLRVRIIERKTMMSKLGAFFFCGKCSCLLQVLKNIFAMVRAFTKRLCSWPCENHSQGLCYGCVSTASRKEIWGQTRNQSSWQGLFNSTFHFTLKNIFPEFHPAEITVTPVKMVQVEKGFPGGSDSKEPASNAGDLGSIPGLEDSKEPASNTGDLGSIPGLEGCPRGGHGSSILAQRIPMDRGTWRATAHGVAKSQT